VVDFFTQTREQAKAEVRAGALRRFASLEAGLAFFALT
jgi:hypothetical protein